MVVAPDRSRLIAQRYRLESLIGEGGMASVWRAIDITLDRPVAVKLMYALDVRHRLRRIRQFKREAQIAAAVGHPNVVRLVDYGTTEQDVPYMVMEMLEGATLGDRLDVGDCPGLEETLQIAVSTLRGLAAVHAAGIVHRDIKPDNIFLHRESGRIVPKILDFGISHLVGSDGQRRISALTSKHGVLVGTPAYMSPEQARGGAIDLRTDIYSMGALLHETLTGRLPFESENVGDLLIAIVTTVPPTLQERSPDVPRVVSDIVQKAMAHHPDDRYASAFEMCDALLAAMRAEPPRTKPRPVAAAVAAAPPPSPSPSPSRSPSPEPAAQEAVQPSKRGRRLAAAGATAVAAALLVSLVFAISSGDERAASSVVPADAVAQRPSAALEPAIAAPPLAPSARASSAPTEGAREAAADAAGPKAALPRRPMTSRTRSGKSAATSKARMQPPRALQRIDF